MFSGVARRLRSMSKGKGEAALFGAVNALASFVENEDQHWKKQAKPVAEREDSSLEFSDEGFLCDRPDLFTEHPPVNQFVRSAFDLLATVLRLTSTSY
jgi:hypothetical protein